MNMGGINYRTSGMLIFDTTDIKLSQHLKFEVSRFLYCDIEYVEVIDIKRQ